VDATQQVAEADEDNNYFSQMVPIPTLPPTCTPPSAASVSQATARPTATPTETPEAPPNPAPAPSATPLPAAVAVYEGQVAIPTFPYETYLQPAWSETFGMPFQVLDRAAYEASNPSPSDVRYRTLTVENEYLKLVFLPEVGGRLYEVVYKPTGHRQTYRNPVLKPSPWGSVEQGWWLAAGGFEWCLPVEEHGYEWGIPWKLSTHRDGNGVTVLLRDSDAPDRVRAEIAVRLEAGQASFTIRPRIENPTGSPLSAKYWTNAMLAPGGHNAPSASLRFILPDPVTSVTVHARGDEALPGYNERMPWPIVNGVDLSRLGNWNRWLGFFEDPAQGEFMAVYDEAYDEGIVRVFPADASPGAKVFAYGWQHPISPGNWTTDTSSYVEIHGGAAPTFDGSIELPAGGPPTMDRNVVSRRRAGRAALCQRQRRPEPLSYGACSSAGSVGDATMVWRVGAAAQRWGSVARAGQSTAQRPLPARDRPRSRRPPDWAAGCTAAERRWRRLGRIQC
jgi:hypothetical protein